MVEFKVPADELNGLDRRVFDMNDPADAQRWADQVRSSRMGDMQGHHNHDVMEGPMVGNPGKLNRADPRPVGQQTSFHTSDGTRTLDRNIQPSNPKHQPDPHPGRPPPRQDRAPVRYDEGGRGNGRGRKGQRRNKRGGKRKNRDYDDGGYEDW